MLVGTKHDRYFNLYRPPRGWPMSIWNDFSLVTACGRSPSYLLPYQMVILLDFPVLTY
jgi:hypothetical protein